MVGDTTVHNCAVYVVSLRTGHYTHISLRLYTDDCL